MKQDDYVFDKNLKLFGKLIGTRLDGSDTYYIIRYIANADGYSIKEQGIVGKNELIPIKTVLKEQIKNHEKALKNLNKLLKMVKGL